jgi:hypothetical protein
MRFPDAITFESIVSVARSRNEVDKQSRRGHTQRTMTRPAQALELRTPVFMRLLVLGLVILSVIVILPR